MIPSRTSPWWGSRVHVEESRVEVPVDRDHRRAAADAAEQVSEPVDLHLVELQAAHLVGRPGDDGGLAGALGRDGNQVAQELDDGRRVLVGQPRYVPVHVTHGVDAPSAARVRRDRTGGARRVYRTARQT
jgi:hypothetical protein